MKKFTKIFALLLSFFFFFNSHLNAEVVKKVKVNGNSRITLETILVYGGIKVGNNYESEDINFLIKKLYETKFFSNISVELINGNLNILVQENPIINNITFNGENTKKYKETLLKLFTLREKSSFMKTYIKSDLNLIKDFYRSLGYYFVKLDAEIEELDLNQINLIITIDKGERAKIAKIFFLGDKKLRDKSLRDVITSQESRFWKFLSKNVYLSKERIELDKRLLNNYYKNKGFYEVQVSSSNVEYSEGQGFILTYSVNAGQKYKFKKIFLNVSEALDKSAFASLEKEFDKVIGKYYSQNKLTSILQKIDKLSEQKELQFINHRAIETLDGDSVEVKIEIFEGDKFIIERIDIAGNSVTNDDVIRSSMIADEGDPFSILLFNKSINKLKSRGIFGKITKDISDGSTPGKKIIKLTVEEKATGEISAGAGVGTDGTAFFGSVQENNWLGRGIKLKSQLNLSTTTISGGISVTNPNFNYSGNSVNMALDVASSDLKTTSGYKSSKTGLSVGTSFEQYENTYISAGISSVLEDIEVQPSSSEKIKKMDGNYYNVDLNYGIILDKRNQSFQPSSGYRTEFAQALPIVIDSSSITNLLKFSGYKSLGDDVIASLKFMANTIHGLDDEDTRLSSRLYLPQNSLRGFNTRKVGPKDGEDYIGGNYISSLNFEASLPNLLPETTKTDVSLFLDTANIWHVDYDDTIQDTNKIRSSIGLAANIWTPVGPLSFIMAQDISKSKNDETEAFNFRIGTSF